VAALKLRGLFYYYLRALKQAILDKMLISFRKLLLAGYSNAVIKFFLTRHVTDKLSLLTNSSPCAGRVAIDLVAATKAFLLPSLLLY